MGFVEVGCNHDLIAISPHCTGKCNPDGMALFGRDFSRLEALIGVVRNAAAGFCGLSAYAMTRATLSLIGHILVVAILVSRTVGGIFPLSVLAAELFRDLAKGVQRRF